MYGTGMRRSWRDQRSAVTVEDLRDMLLAPSHGIYAHPSRPYDQVYPGVIIGDCWTAMDTTILAHLGVTAVLNAAQGGGLCCLVDTDARFYRDRRHPVRFLGVRALDADWCRIEQWFHTAADFIHDARRTGKVLVHCVEGRSRAATLVIAYLMIKHDMMLSHALQLVRSHREIFPNDGFLQQLIQLNHVLMAGRRVHVSWLKDY